MYFLPVLAFALAPVALASSNLPRQPDPNTVFSNPTSASIEKSDYALRIPTSYQSAVMGRRILKLTPLATLVTIFPNSSNHHQRPHENRPPGLENTPIGLMDYIADCETAGNPTILAISIATTFKNVAAGSALSLSVTWTPPYPPASRISSAHDPFAYSATNLPRFSLSGYLEPIDEDGVKSQGVERCFVKTHQDAKYWLPGNRIHESAWMRLVVQQVYWVGGFGDRAYIGWIPVEEWVRVTADEIEAVRLPGEKKGWKEWAMGLLAEGWKMDL